MTRKTVPREREQIVERVKERYGGIASGTGSGCCGSSGSCGAGETARKVGYEQDQLDAVPDGANLGLGCGAPIEHLDPQPGEVVLDLGSGAGFDALLAARRVGPHGSVIGIDMTGEMIRRARENAGKAQLSWVEFREGCLEHLPVETGSVDAVTSNCVINLVPDKSKVFREVARVLRGGGRMVVSDIVLDGRLPEVLERDLLAYVGCIAGAMQREAYFEAVAAAGLSDVRVLRDVDYLEVLGGSLPPELASLASGAGLGFEHVCGKVRSVTFRAVKI